jgi:predicted nucleic acid-binding protein
MASVIFFDTSVLISGIVEFGPTSKSAHRLMDAVAEGKLSEPATAWHCCLEFYSVLTRLPSEYRVSPHQAAGLVESEVLKRFRVVDLLSRYRDDFFHTCAADNIQGGRVYDTHIAEVAFRHDARVLITDNRRHFQTLLRHGIRVLTAEEAGEALL